MISQRSSAKENKDYAKADEIRNALQKQGIILEDSVEGTKWKQI